MPLAVRTPRERHFQLKNIDLCIEGSLFPLWMPETKDDCDIRLSVIQIDCFVVSFLGKHDRDLPAGTSLVTTVFLSNVASRTSAAFPLRSSLNMLSLFYF
jgi:hypothetical protein